MNDVIVQNPGGGGVTSQAYDEINGYLTKEAGLSSEDAKKVADLILNLDKQLKVIDEADPDAQPTEDGECPVLEAASQALVDAVDLAVLAAKLKIDSEKFQAFVRKVNLEHLNNDLDAKIAERLEKITKTLEKMDKAAKSSLFSKIFGWLMVAVSALITVVSCGAAGAVLVGAVVGTVLAVTMQTLTQTGAMEKLTKAIAREIQKNNPGMSKQDAEILAAACIAIAVIVITIASSMCPGQAGNLGSAVKGAFGRVKDAIDMARRVADPALKVVGQGFQLWSAETNYELGKAQSDATKAKAMLKALSKLFEECADDLAELVDSLFNGSDQVGAILSQSVEGQADIARKLLKMA